MEQEQSSDFKIMKIDIDTIEDDETHLYDLNQCTTCNIWHNWMKMKMEIVDGIEVFTCKKCVNGERKGG